MVRSKEGHEIERLELTPLFDEVPADQGGAVLARWEVQEKDFEKQKSDPEAFLTQVRARPLVTVMRFTDYNHDGNSTEFFLQTGVEPCGKTTGIVVGVTPILPRLHAFGTALHPDKPLIMQKKGNGKRCSIVLDLQMFWIGHAGTMAVRSNPTWR